MIKRLLFISFSGLTLLSRAEINIADDNYNNKKYANASAEYKLLANKVIAIAQNSLGFIFGESEGLLKGYKKNALKRFRIAADYGLFHQAYLDV